MIAAIIARILHRLHPASRYEWGYELGRAISDRRLGNDTLRGMSEGFRHTEAIHSPSTVRGSLVMFRGKAS